MLTDRDRTANGRLCPFSPVEDGTDITGHRRIRIRNRQKNGYEWTSQEWISSLCPSLLIAHALLTIHLQRIYVLYTLSLCH